MRTAKAVATPTATGIVTEGPLRVFPCCAGSVGNKSGCVGAAAGASAGVAVACDVLTRAKKSCQHYSIAAFIDTAALLLGMAQLTEEKLCERTCWGSLCCAKLTIVAEEVNRHAGLLGRLSDTS